MVESAWLTKELDALIGVRGEEEGYRDSWRILLTCGGSGRR
jgi:hypothetical protein